MEEVGDAFLSYLLSSYLTLFLNMDKVRHREMEGNLSYGTHSQISTMGTGQASCHEMKLPRITNLKSSLKAAYHLVQKMKVACFLVAVTISSLSFAIYFLVHHKVKRGLQKPSSLPLFKEEHCSYVTSKTQRHVWEQAALCC